MAYTMFQRCWAAPDVVMWHRQVLRGWCMLPGRRKRGQTQRSSPDRVEREEPPSRDGRVRQRRSSELPLERPQHGRDGGASKRQRVMSNMQS